MVGAACGKDSDNEKTTNTTAGGTATTGQAASTAKQGDVIPAKGSGQYGVDASNPKLYTGAGDFKLDRSKCPADWDANQGITDKEIKLFTSLPRSGPLAGFGLLGDGMGSYFKYVNENGGIGGRSIVDDFKDDQYKPDLTKTNVDEAVGSKKYAALSLTLGTPNNLAVWDSTNKECMPQLLNGTGAPQWGDV